MKTRTMRGGLFKAAVVLALSGGLDGCLDYAIDTTVGPDGTGVRVERMEVTRNDDFALSEEEFRALTRTGPGQGWDRSVRVDEDGDTAWVLERRTEMGRLEDWASPASRTLILGTTPDKAGRQLGYVRLGDVVFRSSIQVAVARRSDGTSLVTYRESFLWDRAADALVEFFLQDLSRRLEERYPRLNEAERGAILGFARARIWVAGEEGLFFGENEDEAIARAAAETADQGVKILRVRYPEAEAEDLRQIVVTLFDDNDEELTRLFEEILPGLNLGFNTEVAFRLTMPGTVSVTNAERRDGNTLEWTFSPLDDLTGPVEIFAEAVVEPGSRPQ